MRSVSRGARGGRHTCAPLAAARHLSHKHALRECPGGFCAGRGAESRCSHGRGDPRLWSRPAQPSVTSGATESECPRRQIRRPVPRARRQGSQPGPRAEPLERDEHRPGLCPWDATGPQRRPRLPERKGREGLRRGHTCRRCQRRQHRSWAWGWWWAPAFPPPFPHHSLRLQPSRGGRCGPWSCAADGPSRPPWRLAVPAPLRLFLGSGT